MNTIELIESNKNLTIEEKKFLIDLLPFEKELHWFGLNGTLPQAKTKEKLIEIYLRYQKLHPEIGADKVNVGCPSCVYDMMKALFNNRNELIKKSSKETVEFKQIKQVVPSTDEEMIAFYKSHLDNKGIYYHHKAGYKKLKELYDANFKSHE